MKWEDSSSQAVETYCKMKYPKQFAKLFYNSQYIRLAYDGILLTVNLDFGAAVLADDNLVANLNGHLNLIAVNKPTGTNCNNLGCLRLFLCATCKKNTALGGLLGYGSL